MLQLILSAVVVADVSPLCSKNGTYFDSVTLQCVACSAGLVPTEDRLSCQCPRVSPRGRPQMMCQAGRYCYAHIGDPGILTYGATQCVECLCYDRSNDNNQTSAAAFVAQEAETCLARGLEQMVPTLDASACLQCPQVTAGEAQVTADGECNCGIEAVLEKNPDGSYKKQKECLTCASGFLASKGQCVTESPCELGLIFEGGLCFSRVEEWEKATNSHGKLLEGFNKQDAISISFKDIIDPATEWWTDAAFTDDLGLAGTDEAQTVKTVILKPGSRPPVSVTSATINYLYESCAVGCNRGLTEKCHCLSNLCVMNLYDDAATACKVLEEWFYEDARYPSSANEPGNHTGLPWIMFSPRQSAIQIVQNKALQWSFSLGADGVSDLVFFITKYSLEGMYLGEEKVANHLELCTLLGASSRDANAKKWTRYGTSVISSCHLPLTSLLLADMCRAPHFFDLFVLNQDGAKIPVPVRILNSIRLNSRPNLNDVLEDRENDFLVRRFLLCDAAIGRAGDSVVHTTQANPTYLRWAARTVVEVRTIPDSDSRVYVPTLSITYLDVEVTTANALEVTLKTTFKSEYAMDTSSWTTACTVLFVLACLGVVLMCSLRLYQINTRFPRTAVMSDPGLFVGKEFIACFVILKVVFGWLFGFHVLLATYWLLFFKFPENPYLLLPTGLYRDEYGSHDATLVFLYALGCVTVCLFIYRQYSIFVFFIDREPVRGRGPSRASTTATGSSSTTYPTAGNVGSSMSGQFTWSQHGTGSTMPGFGMGGMTAPAERKPLEFSKSDAPDMGASVWRLLFVANEFNERFPSMRTNPYVTWLLMALFLDGLEWKKLCLWHPHLTKNEVPVDSPYNPYLQYTFTLYVWIGIVLGQLAVRRILAIKFGLELTDLIDMCSLANVSVLILDEPHHGYYLHGKAPAGKGDVCATELCYALEEEAKGLLPKRGLTPENPRREDLQTFEIFVPDAFKQSVFALYSQVLQLRTSMVHVVAQGGNLIDRGLVQEMAVLRYRMQTTLMDSIDQVVRDQNSTVLARSHRDWFWDNPPRGSLQHSYTFFEDTTLFGWTSILGYGTECFGFPTGFEWHVITLEFLMFSIIFRFFHHVYLAVILAGCINVVVRRIRGFLGKRQLSRTAVVDERFLI